MSKRTILFISLAVITISGLGVAVYFLFQKEDNPIEKVEFSFKSSKNIDKIELTDPFGNSFSLIKTNGEWTDIKGNCVMQEGVDNILDVAENIQFKGYLDNQEEKTVSKQMKTNNIKVKFYEHGTYSKTWYIGPSAQDHYGQIMMLEGPNMKITKPVIMEHKEVKGIIQPRFFTDPKLWMCTEIFSYDVDEIKSVQIEFPNESKNNFKILNKGNSFEISSNGKRVEDFEVQNAYRYLQNYKKIHFESANFTMNKKQIDSLKLTTPFCILELMDSKNQFTQLKMYRIPVEDPQENEFGQLVNMDVNRFWCELNNGDIVKCQYFVFNQIIYGKVYFPSMNN